MEDDGTLSRTPIGPSFVCLHGIIGSVAVLGSLPSLWGHKVLIKHIRTLPHPQLYTSLMFGHVTSEQSGCV